jgi:hypothetical protein
MAKAAKKARNKQDEDLEIRNYWQRFKEPLAIQDYEWKIIAWRGEDRMRLPLGTMVTSLSWDDTLIQTVNITVENPNLNRSLKLAEGHRVTVFYRASKQARWRKLWTLRITSVTQSISSESYEIQAADELFWLQKSKDDFFYRKGEGKSSDKRPEGWYAHQIVRDVCKRYGIKVGRLVKGTHKIKKLEKKNASPLSVIEEAYKQERENTGFKYVIRMRNGKLYVTRLRRSKELLIYGGQALDATITRSLADKVATVLTVRAQVEGDGTEKKQTVRVRAKKKVQRRYGFIHDFWSLDEPAESLADLRKQAKRELVDRQEPKREVSLTVPGYPGLQRGDAIKVAMPAEGFTELLYVTAASHSVTPGDYTTDLTLSFDEFYIDKEGEKIREKLCKKAKENGRKEPKWCGENFDPFAPTRKQKPKARNRGDKRPTGGVRP